MTEGKAPLYWRVLRLRHLHPNGWQRFLLVEGVMVVAGLLTLAGTAPIWSIVVLPLVTSAVVKADDLVVDHLKR